MFVGRHGPEGDVLVHASVVAYGGIGQVGGFVVDELVQPVGFATGQMKEGSTDAGSVWIRLPDHCLLGWLFQIFLPLLGAIEQGGYEDGQFGMKVGRGVEVIQFHFSRI